VYQFSVLSIPNFFIIIIIVVVVVVVVIIIISCHRFSFFPGTSPLEPVANPTVQASSLSL
jgi:hypothetical protein